MRSPLHIPLGKRYVPSAGRYLIITVHNLFQYVPSAGRYLIITVHNQSSMAANLVHCSGATGDFVALFLSNLIVSSNDPLMRSPLHIPLGKRYVPSAGRYLIITVHNQSSMAANLVHCSGATGDFVALFLSNLIVSSNDPLMRSPLHIPLGKRYVRKTCSSTYLLPEGT
jgi:hypothetical protein